MSAKFPREKDGRRKKLIKKKRRKLVLKNYTLVKDATTINIIQKFLGTTKE